MSKREKILAAIVGGLMLLLIVGFSVRRVETSFRDRRNKVLALEKEVRDKQRTIRQGALDAARLHGYEKRALPSNLETARAAYQTWVLDCVSKVDLDDPSVVASTPRNNRDIYSELSFTVTGQGDLRQLIELLHRFYSANHLHRIRRLHVKRVEGSKQLDLTLTIEALSLPTSLNTERLSSEQSKRLKQADLAAYMRGITGRNLTGPPNNPPKFEPVEAQTAQQDRPFSLTLKAKDADRLDRLRYRLDGESIAGVSLDPKSGQLDWTPRKVGDYDIKVIVVDDGLPEKTDTQIVKVSVKEATPTQVAPAQRPSFDKAKFVFVTATTESGGRWQAWIHLRTEGKVLKLFAGERFKVGEIEVTVTRVSQREVELESQMLEKRWLVHLGQNLAEGHDVAPAKES
jgi:hypothetical protein